MPATKEEVDRLVDLLKTANEYIFLGISNEFETINGIPVASMIKMSEQSRVAALYSLMMTPIMFESVKGAIKIWGMKTGHRLLTLTDIENIATGNIQHDNDDDEPAIV